MNNFSAMSRLEKFMLFTREVTSRLPRIKGLGFVISLIAHFFRTRVTCDVEVSVLNRIMLLSSTDLIGTYLIFSPQWYDYRERRFIKKILSEGDYVIDVGANIGAYTLLFADLVGSSGTVTAIEAEKDNSKRLIHNLNLNHMNQVVVHNFGVSDKVETLELMLNCSGNAGGHSFYEQGDTDNPPIQVVQCRPLYDFVVKEKVIKLIKFDIEGFEYRVLQGLFRDLPESRWPKYLLIEDNPLRRENDAISLAANRGYKIVIRYDANVFMER